LVQDRQDITAELGEFIQEQDAILGQRHIARHRHMAATDQLHIRDGVMEGAKREAVTRAVRPSVRPAIL
jgi:hypothetical protein